MVQDEGFLSINSGFLKEAKSDRNLKFEKVQKGNPLCVLGREVTMDLVLDLS